MSEKTITIELEEAMRVFKILEEVNDLFHQQLYYKDQKIVAKFAKDYYKEIHALYYDVVWNWLPKNVQDEIAGN